MDIQYQRHLQHLKAQRRDAKAAIDYLESVVVLFTDIEYKRDLMRQRAWLEQLEQQLEGLE